ncbi:MAG: methylthioribulose 1-phosphate dehydratase [Myxococcales bacterium]|nr:methylthioribulose 1-phosphate dehydratase [Myxococcales bacterium]MCB9642949.1 methylthioribulose 1-phosphate dehydratase [Myxococcales bacterium]
MSEKTLWKPTFTTRKRDDLTDAEARALICELCHHFYQQGWASGTGGGFSVRSGERIFMAPSGVQKERMMPEDIFVLNMDGEVIEPPQTPGLKVSACQPLFMHAYKLRNAGAVVHSHGMYAMLATLIYKENFVISNQEMLKGIQGVGAFDKHEVPVISNTAYEEELTDSLEEAIKAYPKAQAVLVKGHGVYIWGRDWMHAKAQAECYHYLFEAAVRLKQLGLDPSRGGLG